MSIADGTIACSSTSAQLKLKNLPPSACRGHIIIMPSFPRALVSVAPLCNVDLTVTFTKHNVKAYDQSGTSILEGWHDSRGANNWHFPLIDADHNSNDVSLFPSDDDTTIIPPTYPPLIPLPPPPCPATTVHNTQANTYWDRIKHEKSPASATQMSYHERLSNGLVASQEWLKRQCKEDVALSNGLKLNTTSPYTHLSHHLLFTIAVPSLMPPTMTSPANYTYELPSVSTLVQFHHASAGNSVPSAWFAVSKQETMPPSLALPSAIQ
jgi:hypothetical protein